MRAWKSDPQAPLRSAKIARSGAYSLDCLPVEFTAFMW
nr:MAG TPA_asm: hypothetical protein [Caudoviricetes sp.]